MKFSLHCSDLLVKYTCLSIWWSCVWIIMLWFQCILYKVKQNAVWVYAIPSMWSDVIANCWTDSLYNLTWKTCWQLPKKNSNFHWNQTKINTSSSTYISARVLSVNYNQNEKRLLPVHFLLEILWFTIHTTVFFLTGSSRDWRTTGMTMIKLVDLAQTSQCSCPSICAVVSVPKPLDRIN